MPAVYRDLTCGGALIHRMYTAILRSMFVIADGAAPCSEHALQHHVTASIQILRNTHVYAMSHQGPVEDISQMLKPITLGAHAIHQRWH